MTFRIIILLLIGSLINTKGMAQLSIGVNGGLGHTASTSKQLEFNNDKLYRKGFPSNYLLGVYGQYRFGKWATTVGLNYHAQSLKFNDPNVSSFSGGAEKLTFKHSSSSVALSLGGKRFFPLNDKTDFYGGLALNFDFYNMSQSAVSSATTANYTGLGPVNLTANGGINSGTGIGLMPEIGLAFKVGNKSTLILYGTLNLGLNETLHGTITRTEPTGDVPQASYTSNSTNTTLGVKYQYNLKSISNEEKQRRAIAKAEKRKAKDATKSSNDSLDDKKLTYGADGMPEKLDNRTIEKQNEVIVQSTEIEFLVWDDKQEDKDSISLYINGAWVLKKYELINKKKVIKVTIDPSKDNYLIMYALNEGKFPPNTCAISIDDGVSGEKRLYLKSTLKSCGAIHFRYKAKQ
jgi:hypothetical protein